MSAITTTVKNKYVFLFIAVVHICNYIYFHFDRVSVVFIVVVRNERNS